MSPPGCAHLMRLRPAEGPPHAPGFPINAPQRPYRNWPNPSTRVTVGGFSGLV